MNPLVFRSKIDASFIGIFLLTTVLALFSLVPVLRLGLPVALAIGTGVLLPVVGLPLALAVSTRYVLTDEALRVQCLGKTWDIPLSSIRAINPSRTLLSSPALSLDRLLVEYGTGHSIAISPADKAGFLQALAARRGDGVGSTHKR